MSEAVYDPNRDLQDARAMIEALADYLIGDQLYGTLKGGWFGRGNQPSLTVGALLLRLRRLAVFADLLDDAQRGELAQLSAQHESIRAEWKLHYTEKLLHEGVSRLDAMKTFFEECSDDPRLCPSIYQPEALRRTIVQEIVTELATLNAEDADLTRKARETDGRLRRFTAPSAFVWASGLEPAYPEGEYWWLYAAPPPAAGRNKD